MEVVVVALVKLQQALVAMEATQAAVAVAVAQATA